MIAGWAVILTALLYLCALFAVAHFGDTRGRRFVVESARPAIYSLTLAVYCTSWTFFGSVGIASLHGLDFLPIYIGPILVIGLGYPLVLRVVRLAKSQNITSVADFAAARYGKSEKVAALVALIAVTGAVPYIALQLKAISNSLTTVLSSLEAGHAIAGAAPTGAVALGVALVLAGFAMAFGTRHIDATEHHDGLVLAIAAESVVKLLAFLCVGAFVTWGMFDGLGDLAARAVADDGIRAMLSQPPDITAWLVNIFLSGCAVLLLPRQFHVAVVENRDERDVKTAAWVFPLYLVLINLFVLPLAIAGRLVFAEGAIDRDMSVLALPLQAGADIVALFTMIGGLSAATAMVIVACVALSIMVSNDLVMPVLLRGQIGRRAVEGGNPASVILTIRRLAIVLLLALAWIYALTSSDRALASIGLLSFAAIAQIAPCFAGGLFWKRANARGAAAGLACGALLWVYTLLLPTFDTVSQTIALIVAQGPMGISWLRPTALFGFEAEPLVHGVIVSIAANILAFAGFSMTRALTPIERLQAGVFVGADSASMGHSFRLWRSNVTSAEVESAVARYLGAEPTRRAFDNFHAARGLERSPAAEAGIHHLRFAEHTLASAIGAASSRLVLSLLLRRRNLSRDAALKLVDDASSALQSNRDMLQTALDFARQGITVFDKDLRLVGWNREFRDLFELAPDKIRIGIGLDELLRYNALRGIYGSGEIDEHVTTRLELLINGMEPSRLRLKPSGRVVAIRSARMPDGGLVTTYTDVTRAVVAEEALAATNETLEQRVRERTIELERLNGELARAKAEADEANISKTRFLAAASHDLLQPLNAARLYASSLVERFPAGGGAGTEGRLARNVEASLEAVEEMLTALLDISQLDAGAMKVELSGFRAEDLFAPLRIEFEPQARERGLDFRIMASSLGLRSDRRLLRRLLQNLISNAVKYTPKGRVLVGARRRGLKVEIQIWDTGIGVPQAMQKQIFQEFERLAPAVKAASGAGLGLSIVERVSRVLDHEIILRSQPGKGSMFSVTAPRAALPKQKARGDPAARAQPAILDGLVVAAIDNEPSILDGMQILLEGWGCAVVTAADSGGAAALLAEQGRAPDVIIADFHLDEGDGLAAIAELRARFGDAAPAVLVTADRTPALRERAAAEGIRVLNKPLKPAALRALLSQWRVTKGAAE